MRPASTRRRARAWSLSEVRWATTATMLFVLGLVTHLVDGPPWLSWALYLACYVTGGWEPAWSGLQALRERTLDVDLLMVAAAIGAAAIGQVFDGALLIVIFATSGALEAIATKRTKDSVHELLALTPERASRLTAGSEDVVDTADLDVGDVILIRPGERVGGDGQVVDGGSDVDQATITGEPLPVAKHPGDEVFAGTLNGTGMLKVRITRPAGDTVIARIATLVEDASATKARAQMVVEKFEQRYSIGMVAATVALFVIPLLFGAALEPTLLRAMTFMIVASPCAVVLATMPPLLSAIANAGRHGVLVKSAVVMEKLATVDQVAFDKTGTLTEGTPQLVHVQAFPGGAVSDTEELLALAATAEYPSEHPLAKAVVAAAHHLPVGQPDHFTSIPGRGISAHVGSRRIDVSNCRDHLTGDALNLVAALENDGHTVAVIYVDEVPAGLLGFTDRVRPGAADTITRLARLTGTTPVLLTGDNPRSAARVASETGISEVRANLLPQDKVAVIHGIHQSGANVMVVGDGVNDAPALAAAHIGTAMGGNGSDLALNTADIVITRDDLTTLPSVVALARRAQRLVIANLTIAVVIICVLVAWDLLGTLPLPLGVAGHEGSTILVGLNGLRLLGNRAWRRDAAPFRQVAARFSVRPSGTAQGHE
ncbi:cadmium-translocating P-type ATPase [Actinosynnema sp. ALI-1.44]|nr:heavy metal translocating P-type ATPase [Actinosynnema sp. ALI-1.44]ONI79970.1 cadmium-translocating P-type ATPase [Actinosynnema sp. ALI-1.44]